ncbi:unnamed protein product [Ectocarpus sp. 13 AM-2016]
MRLMYLYTFLHSQGCRFDQGSMGVCDFAEGHLSPKVPSSAFVHKAAGFTRGSQPVARYAQASFLPTTATNSAPKSPTNTYPFPPSLPSVQGARATLLIAHPPCKRHVRVS